MRSIIWIFVFALVALVIAGPLLTGPMLTALEQSDTKAQQSDDVARSILIGFKGRWTLPALKSSATPAFAASLSEEAWQRISLYGRLGPLEDVRSCQTDGLSVLTGGGKIDVTCGVLFSFGIASARLQIVDENGWKINGLQVEEITQ